MTLGVAIIGTGNVMSPAAKAALRVWLYLATGEIGHRPMLFDHQDWRKIGGIATSCPDPPTIAFVQQLKAEQRLPTDRGDPYDAADWCYLALQDAATAAWVEWPALFAQVDQIKAQPDWRPNWQRGRSHAAGSSRLWRRPAVVDDAGDAD